MILWIGVLFCIVLWFVRVILRQIENEKIQATMTNEELLSLADAQYPPFGTLIRKLINHANGDEITQKGWPVSAGSKIDFEYDEREVWTALWDAELIWIEDGDYFDGRAHFVPGVYGGLKKGILFDQYYNLRRLHAASA